MTIIINNLSREELKRLAYGDVTSIDLIDELKALGFAYGLRAYGMQNTIKAMYEKNLTVEQAIAFINFGATPINKTAAKTTEAPVTKPAPSFTVEQLAEAREKVRRNNEARVRHDSLQQELAKLGVKPTPFKPLPDQTSRSKVLPQPSTPAKTNARDEALKKALLDPQIMAQAIREAQQGQ